MPLVIMFLLFLLWQTIRVVVHAGNGELRGAGDAVFWIALAIGSVIFL